MNDSEKFEVFAGWACLKDDFHLRVAKKYGPENTLFSFWLESLRAIIQHLDKKHVALDVGCHYGSASFWLSQHFTEVHSFDVNLDIARCCKTNMHHFLMNNVKVHPYGLGDREGTYSLSLPDKYSLKYGIKYEEYTQEYSDNGYVKTLDSLNFQTVDFIKLDVEGFEQKVINGGLKTIDRCSPLIMYENSGFGKRYGSDKSVISILAPLGYEIVDEHPYNKDLIIKRVKNGR